VWNRGESGEALCFILSFLLYFSTPSLKPNIGANIQQKSETSAEAKQQQTETPAQPAKLAAASSATIATQLPNAANPRHSRNALRRRRLRQKRKAFGSWVAIVAEEAAASFAGWAVVSVCCCFASALVSLFALVLVLASSVRLGRRLCTRMRSELWNDIISRNNAVIIPS
jgi:hypothetical protein